jgi:GNAT superfamily N-acetyltransferase
VDRMTDGDVGEIVAAFAALGWPGKDHALYDRYLRDQEAGRRETRVARAGGRFAGYVTVVWEPDYPPFRAAGIPEISDLNVLPGHRNRGVGSALMDAAEEVAARRSTVAGLGVGLYADYGAAQRLYVRRGYLPDGRGLIYRDEIAAPGTTVCVDDDLLLMMTRELAGASATRR